jgi:hypothetical protein
VALGGRPAHVEIRLKIGKELFNGGGVTSNQPFSTTPTYDTVRVVNSVCKSDHKAVIVKHTGDQFHRIRKKTAAQRVYRRKSPPQHAAFLQNVSTLNFEVDTSSTNIQSELNRFYAMATALLRNFYPERTVTVTDHDPDIITVDIKAKLRRKNRITHAGRIEEANALAQLIGKEINRQLESSLSNLDSDTGIKQMWQAVRKLTGRIHRSNDRIICRIAKSRLHFDI